MEIEGEEENETNKRGKDKIEEIGGKVNRTLIYGKLCLIMDTSNLFLTQFCYYFECPSLYIGIICVLQLYKSNNFFLFWHIAAGL